VWRENVWLRACFSTSRRPTCPHVRHIRRWTQRSPLFKQSSQPRSLGVTSRICIRWVSFQTTGAGFEITYRYHSMGDEIEVRRADSPEAPVNSSIQLADDGETHRRRCGFGRWSPTQLDRKPKDPPSSNLADISEHRGGSNNKSMFSFLPAASVAVSSAIFVLDWGRNPREGNGRLCAISMTVFSHSTFRRQGF